MTTGDDKKKKKFNKDLDKFNEKEMEALITGIAIYVTNSDKPKEERERLTREAMINKLNESNQEGEANV